MYLLLIINSPTLNCASWSALVPFRQLAQKHAQFITTDLALVPATCIWLLHPAPTSAQEGLDPLQLALGGVFPVPTRAFTNVYAHHFQPCCHRTLQLALVVSFL